MRNPADRSLAVPGCQIGDDDALFGFTAAANDLEFPVGEIGQFGTHRGRTAFMVRHSMSVHRRDFGKGRFAAPPNRGSPQLTTESQLLKPHLWHLRVSSIRDGLGRLLRSTASKSSVFDQPHFRQNAMMTCFEPAQNRRTGDDMMSTNHEH
jgi:hypothetical protein